MRKNVKTRINLFMSGIVLLLLTCNVLTANSQSFVRAVERAKPTVVDIRTYTLSEFTIGIKRYGGGSGVIVDKDKGYILTNYHVIKEGDTILVILPDHSILEATVFGYDHLLDLAILKVDPALYPLKEIEWSNSDEVQIGEWAIAIGYPYSLSMEGSQQTVPLLHFGNKHNDIELPIDFLESNVTVGIVSGTDKVYLSEEYLRVNLIQTDASINPGNSGGPLVNINGQLIGINTFIWTKGGGSVGVGFAISANTVKKVYDRLIKFGYVMPVILGLETHSVTHDLNKTKKLKLANTSGVYVSAVKPGSSAFTAGIKKGDVIISLDGQPIKNKHHFKALVRLLDKQVVCDLIRDGVPKQVKLSRFYANSFTANWVGKVEQPDRKTLEDYTRRGVIITEVEPGSILEKNGCVPGSLIYQINDRKIHSLEDFNAFQERLNALPIGKTVKVRFHIERRIEQNNWYRVIDLDLTMESKGNRFSD